MRPRSVAAAVAHGERDTALQAAGPAFREAFAALETAVRAVFPDAEETFRYGMPGFAVPLPDHARPRRGTFDPTRLVVLLAERRHGLTLHVWNPASYTFLEEHGGPLREAGFKVMKGCLQWNRKAPLPQAAVRALLAKAQASWAG